VTDEVAPETRYVTYDDALAIHAEIFGISPEQASDHVLKPEGLLSALQRPRRHAHYEGADLAMQAAVLGHGIAESQVSSMATSEAEPWRSSSFCASTGVT
jgi:hypothetical protein